MSRPKQCRNIGHGPDVNYYKPKGIPSSLLEEVVVTLDEFEAVKLADFQGLYQEDAAGRMDISRQTFGRIIAAAHRKIADALIHGKALKIEGGPVQMGKTTGPLCKKCNQRFEDQFIQEIPDLCPACHEGMANKITREKNE